MAESQVHGVEMSSNPYVVVIGGGGGTSAIYPEIAARTENAVAILGVFDSGGSTGRLSEQLHIPPVGDFRNVMMAASTNPGVRMLQRHRFGNGDLKGHPVGNVIVAACVAEYGLAEGLRQASVVLGVPGTILPVTLERAELVLEDGPDNIIRSEHNIDVYETQTAEPRVWLEPHVPLNPLAAEAIQQADLIVIPGGSIYTSLLAALSVDGVGAALAASPARKVLLANLATEQHQTDGWHVADYVLALKRHGIDVDIVLYNDARPTDEMLENYAAEGERPVDITSEGFARIPAVRAIGTALLAGEMAERNPNDPLKRGLMRHDPVAVANHLWAILAERASLQVSA